MFPHDYPLGLLGKLRVTDCSCLGQGVPAGGIVEPEVGGIVNVASHVAESVSHVAGHVLVASSEEKVTVKQDPSDRIGGGRVSLSISSRL
jgi:hypothetical protein